MVKKVLFTALLSVVLASSSFAWTTPVPLTGINTQANESGLFISPDGLTAYFDRGSTSEHYWFQIYTASRTSLDEPFTNIKRVTELSANMHISYPWVSSDGLKMYYNRDWAIYVTTRPSVDKPWSGYSAIRELNSLGNIEAIYLTPDEKIAVFDRSNNDLFIASRSDKSLPFQNIRLLSELNTSANEGGASISADGLTIYFTSKKTGVARSYTATRASITDVFGTPVMMDFPEGFGCPRLSPDGSYMILSSNWDHYISYNNTAPVANAGADQVVYAGIDGSAKVVLDGSDSSDPQNDELEYTWSYTVDGQVYEANGVNPTLTLPAGTHTITLVVNDGEFDSEADEVVVEVIAALKVKMKLSPVLHQKSAKLLIARFDFPNKPVGKIEPYSIALAADPNIAVDYVNLTAYKDSILNCDAAFESASIPSGLFTSRAKVVIFGYFKSGQVFYGEDRLVQVYKKK